MRKLFVTSMVTLDGVMQAPGGPDEDTDSGFAHGGWAFHYFDDDLNEVMAQTMGRPFDLLLGRRTYDIFAGYWPTAPQEAGGAPLNAATKYVASRGTPELTWERSVLLTGPAEESVAALKAGDGPQLQVHGSVDLLQTLLRHNLVDELQVLTFPVLVGSGKRLFQDGPRPAAALQLVESRTAGSGVTVSRYQPAGALRTGSFG